MKHLRTLGLIAVGVMTQMAFIGAGSASATTIEITGVKQNGAVTNTISEKPGTSTIIRDTSGAFANTCTIFHTHGTTSSFTGAAAIAPATSLEFGSCTEEPLTVLKPGVFSFESISGTTNGTVRSSGAEFKTPSPFGTLTCTTASTGTDLGTVTGAASGNAEMDVSGVINCGFLSSARWQGSYIVTVPHNWGIVP